MNEDVSRIIGTNGVMQRIGANTQQVSTSGTGLQTLGTIVIPKYTWDEDGREVIVTARGVGQGTTALAKRFRLILGAALGADFIGITVNNEGFWIHSSFTRKDFNTLVVQSILYFSFAFGATGLNQVYQYENVLTPVLFHNDLNLSLECSVTAGSDAIQKDVFQAYRI